MLGQQPVTEKLHPNQQKLDVHEPEKDELTSDDFKKLRAGKKPDMKKEEAEQVDEAKKESKEDFDARQKRLVAAGNETAKDPERLKKLSKIPGYSAAMSLAKKSTNEEVKDEYARKVDKYLKKKYNKEEVEELVEYTPGPDGKTMIKGRSYGASKPESDYVKGPSDAELKKIEAEKKKKQKKFSEMVNVYKTGGLKTFMESIPKEDELIDELSKDIAEYTMDVIDAGEYAEVTIGEEASQDEFNAEIKKAQAKSEGKEKAQVAKPFVQAVKQEETEITDEMIFEMIEDAGIDFESLSDEQFQNVANEAYEIIKERHMTDSEMEKKETIVKSMKKGLSGFKERYGDKAKNVMYATATKQAMK